MTTVKYPSLHFSATKAAVLVDRVGQGFQVYTLPDLGVAFERDSYQDVYQVRLSSSGSVVAWLTLEKSLEIVRGSEQTRYELPYARSQISAFAVADAGDQIALLLSDAAGSRLEIWPLPLGGQPLLTHALPLFDMVNVIANPAFTTLAVHTFDVLGSDAFSAIYRYDAHSLTLSEQWSEVGSQATHVPSLLAVSDTWVWAVKVAGLQGWHKDDAPVTLPGTLRDRILLSSNGAHLLVYRGVEVLDMTTIKYVFRLIDCASLQELKQVHHVVEQASAAHFVLNEDLTISELRVTQEGQLQKKDLGW